MLDRKVKLGDFTSMPIVWMLLIILLGFILGPGSIDAEGVREGNVNIGESGKLIRAVSVIIVALFALFVSFRSKSLRFLLTGTNGWLFAFFLLCFASVIFSPVKSLTLFKSFEILTLLMMISLTYAAKDRYEASKKFIIALLVFYIATVIGVYLQLVIFGTAGQRQLYGATPLFGFMLISKYPAMVGNALGYLGAVVALFGLYLISTESSANRRRLMLGGVVLLLGVGVAFLSYTRSIIVFLYLAMFIYFAYRKKYIVNVLLIFMLIIPLSIPQVQQKILEHMRRGDTDENIGSLSGRTHMWEEVFNRSPLKIVVGDGYATGSKYMNYETTGKLLAQSNVHNGFLEVVMSVGLIGGFVWLGIMVKLISQFMWFFKRAKHKLSQKELSFHVFMMALLFLSVTRSIMNSTFVYLDYFYPVLMAFIMYGDSLKAKLLSLSNENIDKNNEEFIVQSSNKSTDTNKWESVRLR